MIRDIIPQFNQRHSDYVIQGRNRARIVLGTDRKKEITSGFGDGGENDADSSTIDVVVGYQGSDPDYSLDKSRVYITGKTNPDEYFEINAGEEATEASAVVVVADNIYLKARNRIKIVGNGNEILLNNDGTLEIRANGDILIGNREGTSRRVLTEDDVASGTDPITGGEILSTFKKPTSTIINSKVKIK